MNILNIKVTKSFGETLYSSTFIHECKEKKEPSFKMSVFFLRGKIWLCQFKALNIFKHFQHILIENIFILKC
jgi:hypothetical protein